MMLKEYMDERNEIQAHRLRSQLDINNTLTLTSISNRLEQTNITLRKEKMFNSLMAKRRLYAGKTSSENTTIGNQAQMGEQTIRSQYHSYPLLTSLSSSSKLLTHRLKHGYYDQDDSILFPLLKEINDALHEEAQIDFIYDTAVIEFIIYMFLQCESDKLFYLLSSILVIYTFKGNFTTKQLHTVKILDQLIYKVFNDYTNEDMIANTLIILWNIYNDFGSLIISQTELFYYLSLWIINEEQQDNGRKVNNSLNESIIMCLYCIIMNNNIHSLKPDVNSMIPFIVNEIPNASERLNDPNCDYLYFVLSILYSLSLDDDICEMMMIEGIMNRLCELFKYLFLTLNEIKDQKALVLSPKCLSVTFKLFNNLFSLSDRIISEILPEELFFTILKQLLRINLNETEYKAMDCSLSNQEDLMAVVANMAACDVESIKNFVGNEEVIRQCLTLVHHNETVIHVIHVIENIFIRNNAKAIDYLYKYKFMDVISNVLAMNYFHLNVKFDALKVLILLAQNVSESKQHYPFDLRFEIEQRNILHLIQVFHDQTPQKETEIINTCINFITMYNQYASINGL